MCGKKGCKDKSGCTGCGGNDSANSAAMVAQLQDSVDALTAALGPFLCGHPIILVEHADDVACFDLDSGLGADCWEGYALCNGETHKNSKKENIATPNFIDRFVVMAGGTYTVDDTGGEAEHTLTIAEIPAHDHTLTDPGHTHAITDPGHTHQLQDPGHNHPFSDPGHTHTAADHQHSLGTNVFGVDYNSGTGPFGVSVGYLGSGTNYGPVYTQNASISINTSSTGISMDDAFVGLTMDDAFTGISVNEADTEITMAETGGGEAHNNLPPYIAAFYAMKL